MKPFSAPLRSVALLFPIIFMTIRHISLAVITARQKTHYFNVIYVSCLDNFILVILYIYISRFQKYSQNNSTGPYLLTVCANANLLLALQTTEFDAIATIIML